MPTKAKLKNTMNMIAAKYTQNILQDRIRFIDVRFINYVLFITFLISGIRVPIIFSVINSIFVKL